MARPGGQTGLVEALCSERGSALGACWGVRGLWEGNTYPPGSAAARWAASRRRRCMMIAGGGGRRRVARASRARLETDPPLLAPSQRHASNTAAPAPSVARGQPLWCMCARRHSRSPPTALHGRPTSRPPARLAECGPQNRLVGRGPQTPMAKVFLKHR